MNRSPAQRGFTLIELMIGVAVVAVIAAIAYPSFTEHLRKSRRAQAQQALMDVALRQQQFLLDTRAYAGTLAEAGVALPTGLAAHYTVTLSVGDPATPSFTVTATPQGGQAADPCGTLSVAHTGAREPQRCW